MTQRQINALARDYVAGIVRGFAESSRDVARFANLSDTPMTNDEIAMLGKEFNRIAERIEKTIDEDVLVLLEAQR